MLELEQERDLHSRKLIEELIPISKSPFNFSTTGSCVHELIATFL